MIDWLKLKIFFSEAKIYLAIKPSARIITMNPCETVILKRKATPKSLFRRFKCAHHRLPNGKWEANPIDPID